MKELFLQLIQEERKRIYMSYYINEMKQMIEKLKNCSTPKNLHEKVIKLRRRVCKQSDIKSKVKTAENVPVTLDPNNNKPKAPLNFSKAGVKHKFSKTVRGIQKLIDKIQEGRLYNSENEQVKKTLLQLEQKLLQLLQGIQSWMNEMKTEKAKEQYARMHRTSIMIKENYESKHGSTDDSKTSDQTDHTEI